MSLKNVEIVKQAVDDFNRRNLDDYDETLDAAATQALAE
jgi:hypothetical protein